MQRAQAEAFYRNVGATRFVRDVEALGGTGFSYDRPKGKNHCVMRRTVSPPGSLDGHASGDISRNEIGRLVRAGRP
jgi:hypothetical protein